MKKWYVLIVVDLVIPSRKFILVGYSTHWEDHITCFKYNENSNIARDCPKNDGNRNCDEKESNAEVNGILIVTLICETCDEERFRLMKNK